MPLVSRCGLSDTIKSTVLIEAATQNVGYAKSLQERLKCLSITKVEFHCLMPLSPTQFRIPELSSGPPTVSQIHLRHTSITHKS